MSAVANAPGNSGFFSKSLAAADPAIAASVSDELKRQQHKIELIASENYASPAVMAAQGSQLTNKYAEGYPGKRIKPPCAFANPHRPTNPCHEPLSVTHV